MQLVAARLGAGTLAHAATRARAVGDVVCSQPEACAALALSAQPRFVGAAVTRMG